MHGACYWVRPLQSQGGVTAALAEVSQANETYAGIHALLQMACSGDYVQSEQDRVMCNSVFDVGDWMKDVVAKLFMTSLVHPNIRVVTLKSLYESSVMVVITTYLDTVKVNGGQPL